MSRELDEIRLLNKKNHQQERQRKEEEEKRKKNDGSTMVLEVDTAMTEDVPVVFQEGKEDEDVLNFTTDVHNIMNGFEEMITEEHEEDNKEEWSPRKKRPGSSKTYSQPSRTAVQQVSPPDSGAVPASSRRTSLVCQVSPNEVGPTITQKPAA